MEGSARRRSRAACSEAQSLAGFFVSAAACAAGGACGAGIAKLRLSIRREKLRRNFSQTQFARETRGLLVGRIGAQTNQTILVALAERGGGERSRDFRPRRHSGAASVG
jgi:hypothetical protein